MIKGFSVLVASAVGAIAVPSQAQIVTNFNQVGTTVVASTTGSISLTGLTSVGNFGLSTSVIPNIGYIGSGTANTTVAGYSGLTGPTRFGTGAATTFATTSTGTNFAFNASGFGLPYIFLPTDYTSNSSIVSSSIFNGATFASLGLTVGQYVWSLGASTYTVNITATAAVPEPASWAMMILGIGAMGIALRRRAKVTTRVSYSA